ncbi:MAG: oxygenase MpaB family protein [Actinomycetota bacterium]|nr:oxygenase MpaB family protein [Actinomycetota bacterium]
MTASSPGAGPLAGFAALVDGLRDRVVGATSNLFSHGPYPLARTLDYAPDPGLFGPESMTWPVVGDTAVFVGGIRALLVQAAHPEVAAGVADHSRYREDPLGRLTRTAAYVTATSFGAMPEVEHAVAVVRRRHRPVRGTSDRGQAYDASDPALSAWVHNSLTDSFLTAYRVYGAHACSVDDADRFVAEQVRVGELLGADPLPGTAADLAAWVSDHPALAPSPGAAEAIRFLRRPPLAPPVRAAYGLLFRAAVATLPESIKQVVGVRSRPADLHVGRAAVSTLRVFLGSSPDWRLALVRVGAPQPPGAKFRQPLPASALGGDAPGARAPH